MSLFYVLGEVLTEKSDLLEEVNRLERQGFVNVAGIRSVDLSFDIRFCRCFCNLLPCVKYMITFFF